MQYWGFDLGDGESTLARVSSEGKNFPEIVEVEGNKVIITVWAIMRDGEVRIGDYAARSAAAAVRSAARFKRRFLNAQSDSAALIRDFSARVFEALRGSGELVGGEKSNSVYVGCPAGWDAEARERYQRIFETIGFPTPHVVSESRAVMVGAIQSNSVRDSVDLRSKTVLVIDIGSSTTDFAYINKGREAEIRTGGEVALGGGVMDEVLLNTCVAKSPKAAALRKVLEESESWRVDCELHARHLKERYYSMSAEDRAREECAESLLVTYDEPLILDLRMDEDMSRTLTDRPCPQLGGKSFRQVFCAGLREVRDSIGKEQPELLFLTGGVSRMEEIRDWCREVFPDAVIYTDREPEFSVARGLAWCGRIDDELLRFRRDVDELISSNMVETLVSGRLNDLYRTVSGQLSGKVRFTFEAYVQQYYFKQVVAAANKRLTVLTDGLFTLRCKEEARDRVRQSGLDLDVLDRSTGQWRDVSTLSGGESFLASLALALGLSDVVQAQSGAIRMDAMFIDEGFGTLDDNALRNSLQVLSDLADGKRLIGIISHVHDLEERIEKQIVVSKTLKGSKIDLFI